MVLQMKLIPVILLVALAVSGAHCESLSTQLATSLDSQTIKVAG